jgi:hypothetical protein
MVRCSVRAQCSPSAHLHRAPAAQLRQHGRHALRAHLQQHGPVARLACRRAPGAGSAGVTARQQQQLVQGNARSCVCVSCLPSDGSRHECTPRAPVPSAFAPQLATQVPFARAQLQPHTQFDDVRQQRGHVGGPQHVSQVLWAGLIHHLAVRACIVVARWRVQVACVSIAV